MHHAALVALPAIPHRTRDFEATKSWTQQQRMEASRNNSYPYIESFRRPDSSECEVEAMFAQTWGSTALGYGGIGGAAMTPAYTVVVAGPDGSAAVYWAGRFAYLVPKGAAREQLAAFMVDVRERRTAGRMEAVVRYGALTEPTVVA